MRNNPFTGSQAHRAKVHWTKRPEYSMACLIILLSKYTLTYTLEEFPANPERLLTGSFRKAKVPKSKYFFFPFKNYSLIFTFFFFDIHFLFKAFHTRQNKKKKQLCSVEVPCIYHSAHQVRCLCCSQYSLYILGSWTAPLSALIHCDAYSNGIKL